MIFTYFEEHDVVVILSIHIKWVFVFLFNPYLFFISSLKIVGAKNHMCRFPE